MKNKVQIFREEPGFLKLFSLFKEKYRSLGRIGGSISLKKFDNVELASIAGYLGQSKEKLLQKGSIPLLDFERELANTGFTDWSLLQLLEEVLQESILTKKEELEQEKWQEASFIKSLKEANPEFDWWFDWIQGKSPDTRWIWSLYKQNKAELAGKLRIVSQAFSSLLKEGESERLPVFSQRITGNPHYFDTNGIAGKLLLQCLYVDQILKGNRSAVMSNSVEELNELLAEYGIIRDDLWNFVTCQGLLASRQNSIHPVWQAAVESQSVMNVPMKELSKIDKVWPNKGTNVWIVENSSVCSTIMDAVPNAAIVCTHGQLRLASWRLLDLLVQSGNTLFYSGDIDPEGIIIAERLKKRYKEQVVIWRMDKMTYETSLSNEDISSRFSMLDGITSLEWKDLLDTMRREMKAGYQEAIVSNLISDIEKNIN